MGRRQRGDAQDELAQELAGRLQGFAVRVPVPTASLVDLTVEVEHETSAQAVNLAMREHADHGGLTLVTGGTQVKVIAWYDNEWGYSSRLVDLAQRVLVPVAQPV